MDEKGYAGGLVVSAADREHIGLLGFWPDDTGVSFTVLAGLFSDGLAGTETDPGRDPGQMCEGLTSRICGEHFRKGSRIGVRD